MGTKRANRIALVFCRGGSRANEKINRKELSCDCKQAAAKYPDELLECAVKCPRKVIHDANGILTID